MEAGTLAAAILTVALWTFLIDKDNPIYELAQHTFAGLAVAYDVAYQFHTYILPTFQTNIAQDGEWHFIIPLILGALIYLRYVPGYEWVARYPMSWWLGYGSGFVLGYQPVVFVEQITASFWQINSVNNFLLLVLLLGTLAYFFFTVRQDNVLVKYGAPIGRWGMMIALGASFGSSALYRYSLFMGRVQFMLFDFLRLTPG